jgi:hypothetical protein
MDLKKKGRGFKEEVGENAIIYDIIQKNWPMLVLMKSIEIINYYIISGG